MVHAVIAHVVLLKPRPDLSVEDRRALVAAFERAAQVIPSVRGVRVGRRVRLGAGYEDAMPDSADVLAVLEFDDLAGLAAYLEHPAHEELGERFRRSLSSALIYDFEVGGLELARALP
jgi:hypothetical protein